MRLLPLASAWALTRLWVLLSGFQIIAYPESRYLFSDVRLYDLWSSNLVAGNFPVNDPMWQYPPLAALVFLAGYLIAPNAVGFVFLALVADALIFGLLVGRGRITQNSLPAMIWVAIDGFLLSRRVKKLVAEKFPDQPTKGLGLYGWMRSTQLRRLRAPAPQVGPSKKK